MHRRKSPSLQLKFAQLILRPFFSCTVERIHGNREAVRWHWAEKEDGGAKADQLLFPHLHSETSSFLTYLSMSELCQIYCTGWTNQIFASRCTPFVWRTLLNANLFIFFDFGAMRYFYFSVLFNKISLFYSPAQLEIQKVSCCHMITWVLHFFVAPRFGFIFPSFYVSKSK